MSTTDFASGAITATTAAFRLAAGRYLVRVHAADWTSQSAALQILGPDGLTYVGMMTPLTADGSVTVDCPEGQYKIALTGSNPVFCDVSRVHRELQF